MRRITWWLAFGATLFMCVASSAAQSTVVQNAVAGRESAAPTWIGLGVMLFVSAAVGAQQAGSLRGVVYDKEFDAPLADARVTIAETGAFVKTTDEGRYVFPEVPAGTYTLSYTKDGFQRQVKPGVTVIAGELTDIDIYMANEFTDLEEFVVEDIQVGGSEAALFRLRFDSPAFMDSIGADLMSQAGASDAAAALRLVPGATVQDGKFAVIRGLPDRYVSSQLNGIRLPSADEDKRAVELDQFPATVIESIQVTKTFTPDQQGDASGGAVNVVLKGIPTETSLQFKAQVGYNSQVTGRNDFLTYKGGGLTYWGDSNGDTNIQPIGTNWDGAVGVSEGSAPIDSKWSVAGGGSYELDDDVKIGGFANFFHEQDSAFFDNGIDNSLWVTSPGAEMSPEYIQGTPLDGDFKTRLFDVTQGTEFVQWGGLGTAGIETEFHRLGAVYLYTQTSEDQATLAEDTRGKEYYFPGYNPNDPNDFGNSPDNIKAAPYIRTETLEYTERTIQSLIFNGKHTIAMEEFGFDDTFAFESPEIDWVYANSKASLDQPDKRQFGSLWHAPSFNPALGGITPAQWFPFKPAANFTLGNLQRIWKTIDEDSNQYAVNLKLPFTQWTEDPGFIKFGVFDDQVERTFTQDTFSNFNDNSSFLGGFDEFWSAVFPFENHPITDGPPYVDVDYDGEQKIFAWYGMADLPVTSYLNLIGGARVESTDLSIVNFPEANATWFPPGAVAPVQLNPGDADVNYSQDDLLPAVAGVLEPLQDVTFRASFGQTVARQTFKELTPIIQQEYLGGPIFIGNPDLTMSNIDNYDLRMDFVPYDGGLISLSYFYKDIRNPIEYVQRVAGFSFTTPVNYPKGWLDGWEIETRQNIGHFFEGWEGMSIGANATLINSEVTLPEDEAAQFDAPNIQAPMSTRNMTGAPDYLYNLYVTYEWEETGTEIGLFYTVNGPALVAGAGVSDGNYVPNVYSESYGTLNFTLSQPLGKWFQLQFQAKNLTNPEIQTVYSSPYIGRDVLKTSYTAGIELTIGLTAEIVF